MNRAEQIIENIAPYCETKDKKYAFRENAVLEAMKQIAYEVWQYVTDQYETHSINKELERIEFEKWYNKQIEL